MSDQVLTQAVWWCTNTLEAGLLYRAARGRFLRRYIVFYSYLAYVLAYSLVAFCVYTFRTESYSRFYWGLQYVSITIGYCVIWEIYRQVFKAYPGALRVTRVLLAAILVFVIYLVVLNGIHDPRVTVLLHHNFHYDLAVLLNRAPVYEQSLRVVQAALLVTIVALVAYYSIPVGRNIRGMILGYGLYIGLTALQLALGSSLGSIWKYTASASYMAALITWCVTLWSYQPNPAPAKSSGPEYDYQTLATHTAKRMSQVRSSISRTIRP